MGGTEMHLASCCCSHPQRLLGDGTGSFTACQRQRSQNNPVTQSVRVVPQGPPGSQPSPHAQPPPHNPSNPMMGPHGQPFMSPRYPGGPRPSLRMPNQPPVGVPGSQPLLPNSLDPTRPQGALEVEVHGPTLTLTQVPQGEVALQELQSCLAQEFPMGPGPDGPMGGMGAMEPHHMNGSLGSGDMDGLPKNSPNNMAGMNNPPGTPRDDGEMAGNFLNPFQSESPPGMSLERRTHIKTAHLSRVCKVGGNRKQSQSHRKSLLTDSPCVPGFLTGPGQRNEAGNWVTQVPKEGVNMTIQ
ncbi:hypothetical protein JZ751_024459 [Albula glossodonta]|uniref:Uncharacterized protein n=1 Tax=Albula glossodonta TaxID=121402 RepID=A0A8T2PEP8_9TELE|nr:hypothetical protein JZ751_024459 [Albula glossodonta]